MSKPIIGLTGSLLPSSTESGDILCRNFVNDAYVRAVVLGGGVPVILPVLEDMDRTDAALELCDGFLIPGGIDVCPEFYHEGAHEKLGEVYRPLDIFDLHVIDHALARRKPLLGICRGEQILNIALGGSLYQDISEYPEAMPSHCQEGHRYTPTHDIMIESNSRLYELLKPGLTGGKIRVNTLHHQFVKSPGEKIVITAHAPDGVIEAFETPDGLVMAVQWHPEELIKTVPVMLNLFADLVQRAEQAKQAKQIK